LDIVIRHLGAPISSQYYVTRFTNSLSLEMLNLYLKVRTKIYGALNIAIVVNYYIDNCTLIRQKDSKSRKCNARPTFYKYQFLHFLFCVSRQQLSTVVLLLFSSVSK